MNPDEAKEALQKRGIRFDEKRVFKYLQTGDDEVVGLLLDAGVKPTVRNWKSESAIVVAARNGNRALVQTLLDRGASSGDLVEVLNSKKGWKHLLSRPVVLTVVSSLIIAVGGWYFTDSYNDHQLRLAEMQSIEKMIPHLVGNERTKEIALVVISELASSGIATQLAEKLPGKGPVNALRRMADAADSEQDRSLAISVLATIGARSNEQGDAALEALRNADSMKKRDPATILWVDDNPANNSRERNSFEALGIRVETSTSTQQALELLQKKDYGVVISDMGRRDGSRAGYQLLSELRERGKETPFFIYAGSNLPEHKAEALRRGAQGSTNQPRELFRSVLKALESSAR